MIAKLAFKNFRRFGAVKIEFGKGLNALVGDNEAGKSKLLEAINPELAKKNPRCLEYIVVHELTHLHERSHSQRFVDLIDQYLPDWRARRDELNDSPLASEEWHE